MFKITWCDSAPKSPTVPRVPTGPRHRWAQSFLNQLAIITQIFLLGDGKDFAFASSRACLSQGWLCLFSSPVSLL